jgi:hypothetical protein
MELNYTALQARPLRPTFMDSVRNAYWAKPAYYHRQALLALTVVVLIAANVIG